MATLQDVLKENKELQKKQNTTTVAPIGNPASPYNKAVQTGNPNVQAGRQKISVTPTAQKQTYTTPLQAQTAGSKKAVDLLGNAIGTGTSQTVQMGSSLLKGIPKVAETGARITNNLFGNAPVSPMQTKLNPSEIKTEEKEGNLVQRLANALLGEEKETATVELPKTEQDVTKNRFQNIANNEMIARGEQPVRQITDWSDPWSNALSQNVENVQNLGQAYNQAVRPITDAMDTAVEGINNFTDTNFAQNLNPTEQFVSQAIGGALPNLARNTLLGAMSGGSEPVLRVLSDAAMFIPSFYEGLADGQARGLSTEEAMLNAIVRGAIETGTEQMSDVWKLTGGGTGLDEFLIDKIAMSNASPFLKSLTKNILSVALEANEDVASSFLNTLADTGFYGQELNLKDMASGMLQEGAASAMSTFVMGLLTGEFSSNSFRNFQAYSDYLKNKTNDKLDIYDDSQKFKTETALLYASMNDEEKAQLLAQTQQEMAKRFGADDDIARMDLQELKDYADRAAEKQIMGLTEEQYAAYIDDMNGTSEPVATVTVKGQPYDVYEYLGVRTPDQDRAMDIAERLGVKAYIVEDLPGGQNAQKMGDGTILISAKAKRPAKALIFHEIFHKLRSDGTWNELLDLAFTNMTKEVGYERYVEDMVAKYVPYYGSVDDNYLKGVALSKESTEKKKTKIHDYLVKQGVDQYYADPNFHNMIDEEIAAEFLERFNNEDTIKAMYNRSGNVFERMWQDLKDSVQNFTGVLTKEEQELKNAERLFAKVANQAKEEQQKAEDQLLRNGYNFHQEDGTLYSVGYSTAAENLANVDRAQLVKDIVTASNGAITEERADEFVRNEEVMAMSIKDTALDFEAEPGETAIKSNTDYPQGTIDLTNNCTKRRPITFMTNRLQEALPDDLFTADDYADIRLIMMDDGRVVACGLCFVEDRRKQLGEIAQNFRDEWANSEDGYLWRSNSSGKRIKVSIGEDLAKRYGVNPGDVTVNDLNMRQVDFGSSDSWHKFQKEHPYEAAAFEAFNNARGQNAGRLLVPRAEYKREILYWSPEKVKSVNDLGGLRIFSFSDFESIHMLDIIQIIEDCAARGVMIQGYTKQPNFAKLVRNTGIKLNRSLIPYGATGLKMVNGKWVLAMNTSEGMDIQSKDFLDETDNPNVGNNITGINDRQIHVAMTDDFIHYIIPFHTGKSNKANLRLGVGKWDNYKDYQTDKSLSPEDTRRLALRTSELKAQGVADTEAYKKAMKELEIKPTKGKMINIYTEVLSDPSVTDVVSFQNKFFDVCYEKGIIPRFSQFLDTDQYGNYVYTPGYEKMLVDFKLFDRDGNVLKQEIVRPDFDKGFMQQVIDEDLKKTEEERQGADYPQELYDKVLNYIRVKHGYDGDYQAYEELKNKIDKNVTQLNSDNESVQGYALSPSVTNSLMELNVQRPTINDKYSQFASPAAAYSLSDDELDRLYFDALEREGNKSPEARRLLDERANERGYTDRAYHGTTEFGFTVPDTQYSDDKLSFFATDDPTTAQTYSGYNNVRPITETDDGENNLEIQEMELDGIAYDKAINFATAINELAGIQGYVGNIDDLYETAYETASDVFERTHDIGLAADSIGDYLSQWEWDAFYNNHDETEDIDDWYMSQEANALLEAQDSLTNAILNRINTEGMEGTGIYDLRINGDNLLRFDARGNDWNNINIPSSILPEGINLDDYRNRNGNLTTRGLAQLAKDAGYEGFEVNNLFDDGGRGADRAWASTVFDFFNPQSQVKSNDLITYDDEGNIIPPSQRYNANNPDIRYSLDAATEFANKFGETEDGRVLPTDPNSLTNEDWKTIQKAVDKLGYGIGSAKTAKEVFGRYVFNNGFNAEQSEAIRKAYGVSNTEQKQGNPTRAKEAKKVFGTTGNFDEAGYLLQDGTMLDFSGKREGGMPGRRDMDHREINAVFDEEGNGTQTWFMDKFIDEGNIRLIPGFGTTIGEQEPTAKQYAILKQFIDHVIDGGDDFYLDLSNADGTTVASRYYTKADNGNKVINDIKAYFKEGELPYRSEFADFRYSLDDGTLESAVYIKDGVRGDGSAVSFVDDILDRRKLGETRNHPNMPTGWQGLTRGGRGSVVEGRAFFDNPYQITKESPEYASAMIEGTEYDIPDGGSKWYYPILDVEDFRDNPKPVLRNSPGRAKYSVEDIPEQANAFADRNIPQNRSAMNFLGQMSRERGGADPLTYESISPESFPVPDRIQDYIDLINDEEDRKYGFDAPIENELTDEDKDFYQGLSANRTGALQGFATPTQTFNAIAKGEQREELRDRFERPMYETKKEYNANREQRWNALENMIKETGIQANTPESAAVQWYGEGVKPNEQGETIPYTLDDLKREFPNKWQDIQKMERFMRQMYDEYVGRINAALEQVYPNLEEKAQAQLQAWKNAKSINLDNLSMPGNSQGSIDYWENQNRILDKKIAKLEGDLESGEYFRNKRLNPRKDYFHHFQEVETSGLGGLKNILQASTLIDPELVGKTEFTKPKSRWMAWLQKRGEGAYTADAVLGMGKYIDSAEYAIAFDPLIAQYRDEISKMVRATRETKNANQLIQYLSAYTNQLAGKTASLDRTILDLLGEGNRGQLFNVLAAINNRAKSNAVVGNVRSAVAQIFNIPNALGIIKSNNAWLKGANDYINAKLGNRELLDQSPFLQERYFSHNVDDLKARNTNWEKIIGKAGDITNKMMEFGDREATELIWLAAYNEGLEKNVSDPIYYADDLTRRSVAGRGIGEVPYNMKSKVASFFMPFQTETNNAWQELKQNLRDKDANGIFRLMLGSYILNGFAKLLFNDGVVPDVLGALIDGIRKLFDKDREESVGEVALDTGRRMAGEAVSYIPGTSLWLPAIMSDESAEALFGDSDPTRYGTGTVGLSTITKTLADAVDGGDFDVVTPLLQMGLPYGGRQASRLYNTLQDFNVLPSNGVMNTPIGGERNPVAGDYTQAGALKYRLPEEVNSAADVAEIARALAFGSNSTNAASEYYDTLKPVLSKERVAKLREHPEVNPDTYIDYLNEASTDGKQGITQQEAYDWISSHNLSDEEANALWEMTSSSWKKSYDEYVPKADEDTQKKEEESKPSEEPKEQNKKSGNPTTKKEFTAVADSDGNGSLKQAEAYAWLNDQKLSDAEKAALWELMGWKTDYATYASKH